MRAAALLPILMSVTLACSDDGGDDELGSASGSTSDSSDAESSTGETGTSTSESGTSETGSTSETSTSETTTDPTSETTTDPTSETTTDPTSETATDTTGGDPSCEDDLFLGGGIANDGWGLGDFCDDIYVCASADQVATLEALDGEVACEAGMPWGCPDMACRLSMGGFVEQALYDRICEALLLPGIDEVWCVVYGP